MAVLDGIRVVVTGSAAALDMASLLLSDNGAEVIRVEPPGGDPRRGLPAWRLWNRGTRSIVLDATAAADRDAASALVDAADVLLEAQGGTAGLGWSFGYPALAARNPGLVHCTVTAFGRSGELSWLPPYDGVVEARSGANVDLGVTLDVQTPAYRARPNPSYGAANIAVQSIAAALLVRERDGGGQHIDTSLYQGLLAYDFSSALRRQNDLGELDPPLPATARRVGPFLPYLAVRCQDGQWMQITNNTARLFRHWMEVIGLAHIWDDPRWKGAPSDIPDLEAKVELAYLILDRMGTRTFDEWLDIFLREGLTGDHFLTTQQALDHPQVIHNGSVIELDDPEVGPTLQLGPTIRFADSPAVVPTAAPLLDADRAGLLGTQPPARKPPTPANGQAAAAGPGPLAGMLVLDFATWLACPFGTSLLADMGARVIKVESPAGDDARHGLGGRARTFQGKESLAIDLKSEEGLAAVRRLVAQADAVMHNMRGDAAARLGIDYESARKLNPGLVYLYAGSYGSTGPGAGRAAFHPMMGALSGGALRQIGRGNEPPAADVPLDAGRPLRVLAADDPLERGLARHHRRPRRRHRAEPRPAAPPAHRPRPVHRDHHAGQQPAAVLRRRHPLRGQARPARTRRRPQGHQRAQPAVPDGRGMAVRVHPDRTGMAAAVHDGRPRRMARRCPVPDGRLAPALQRPARGGTGHGARSTAGRRHGSRRSPGPAWRASAPTPAPGMTSSCPTRKALAMASW